MTVRRSSPAARTGKPRTITAAGSLVAALGTYLATDQGSGLLAQVVVFLLVAGAGALLPSLRLTDPATRETLTTDSTISSVILSLGSALGAAIAAGELPVPDSARGMILALLAGLAGTHFPAVTGTALAGLRGRRGRAVPGAYTDTERDLP